MTPDFRTPSTWSTSSVPASSPPAEIGDAWWKALADPAIDAMVPSALADSPTLAQAVAHMDEARAVVGASAAQRLPALGLTAAAGRGRSLESGPDGGTSTGSTASAGLTLSWELDLFGRVRETVTTARERLAARTADARGVRLALAAEVADGVLALRGCAHSLQVQTADIASRARTLAMTRDRLAAGFVAAVDEARAASGLANARTELALRQARCERQVHALVALTGLQGADVRERVLGAPGAAAVSFMPEPPLLTLAEPAAVLAAHPKVMAADREAAAAWADIGVARAARLPRIDLGALLTGNWMRAAGSTLHATTWSFAANLAAPLFDGGAGAAGVDAAEARYRASAALLVQAVRHAAQEIEVALTDAASAARRMDTTREAVAAARTTLSATEARWLAGATSLFELEDARRQFAGAEDSAIAARRDRAQAWVALIRASGNSAEPASFNLVSQPDVLHANALPSNPQ